MKVLITGCAGFIGFHLSEKLLKNKNFKIVGIDNLNSYYSVKLKKSRLNILKKNKKFKFFKIDISNYNKLKKIFNENKFDIVINLAAQAGVRYSIINPKDYVQTNILGFFNILELCRIKKIKNFFYASSSSVYGDKKIYPVSEKSEIIPKNIYSFSKKSNEDIADIYWKQYSMKSIGLRFFTVYGEWGRPDMLMMKYMIAKKNNKKFFLNNNGKHFRDFTYIFDVVEILNRLLSVKVKKNEVYNICSNKPINVNRILNKLNKLYGRPLVVNKKRLSIEVLKTHGLNTKIKKTVNFKKFTSIDMGIKNLVIWAKKNLEKV